MPEYPIIAKIDPAGVVQGSQKVKQELRGLETAATQTGQVLNRAFDLPSVDKIAEAATRGTASVSNLGSAAAKAAQGQGTLETATRRVVESADKEAAALVKLNGLLATAKQLHADGAISAERLAIMQAKVDAATSRSDDAFSKHRSTLAQLNFSFQDITHTIAAGGNALGGITAAAGPAAAAITESIGVSGSAGKAARFLGGPWGFAISAGITLLGGLATAALQSKDAFDEELRKLRENAAATEDQRRAKELFKHSEEGVAAAIRDGIEAAKESSKSTYSAVELSVIAARTNLNEELTIRKKTAALLAQAIAQAEVDRTRSQAPGQRGEIATLALDNSVGNVAALQAKLTKENSAIAEAEKNLYSTRVDLAFELAEKLSTASGRVAYAYDQQIAALERVTKAQVEAGKKVDGTLTDQVVKLQQRKTAAVEAPQAQERLDKSTTRSPQRVLADFESELRKRGLDPVSGYRNAAKQNDLYRQGLTPADGYKVPSRHQSYRAVDVSRATFNDQKAREAAQAAGLKGFEILTESGGRKHLQFTGAGKRGEVDTTTGEREAAAAERARAKAANALEQQKDFVSSIVDSAAQRGQGGQADTLQAQIARALADFKRRFDKEAGPEDKKKITTALTDADARETAARFDQAYVEPLKRLQAVQGKTGLDRQILNAQLDESVRRYGPATEGVNKLSDAENKQIEGSIRAGDAQQRQADILAQIKQPFDDYKAQIEALTALLNQGAISQTQFNARVSDLGGAARDAISSVPGVNPGSGDSYATIGANSTEDDRYAKQLQSFESNRQQILNLGIDYDHLVESAEQEHQRRLRAIQQAGAQTRISAAQDIAGSLLSIAEDTVGKQSAVYKGLFIVEKAFAIASSIIKIQQGIAEAAALPFPANLGAIASVVAATASIISNIKAVTLNFADGGYVSGPGGPRDDRIQANLSDGEFVVNASAVSRPGNRALLEAVNNGNVISRTRAQSSEAASSTRGPAGGDSYQISVGDVIVQSSAAANGDGRLIGREVKAAITGIIRDELANAKRDGGALTRQSESVMAGG